MSDPSTRPDTRNVRAAFQPRRPMGAGKIEKARNPRHALTRLLPYLNPFRTILPYLSHQNTRPGWPKLPCGCWPFICSITCSRRLPVG
jgi:hypothetical protein